MGEIAVDSVEPISPVAERDPQPVPVRERDLRGWDRGEELRERREDYAFRGRDPVIKQAKYLSPAEYFDVQDRDFDFRERAENPDAYPATAVDPIAEPATGADPTGSDLTGTEATGAVKPH